MGSPRLQLKHIVTALAGVYGEHEPQITDPFEMILLENAAYLAPDDRRLATFKALRSKIGTSPEKILEHDGNAIADVITGGGMQPEMRAGKVLECARIAREIGLDILKNAIRSEPLKAKKLLRRFPGVGEPYADRILLFNGAAATLAPDSNALRVLARLGFVAEEKNYSKMYKAAVNATKDEAADAGAARRAHLLLRRHGQEVCKRADPMCDVCVIRADCAWYENRRRRAT